MKSIVTVAVAAGCLGLLLTHATVAEEGAAPDFDATFSLTAASDYFDSGLTQSDNQAVIQPMLELYYGAFYGSVWASNVDYGKGEDADAEVELIAGVAPTLGPWTFDLSLTSYQYPGEESDAYTYVFGSATHDFGNGLSLGAATPTTGTTSVPTTMNSMARPTTRSIADCRSVARPATTSIMTGRGTIISVSRAAWSCRCRTASKPRRMSATNTTSPTRARPRISGTTLV